MRYTEILNELSRPGTREEATTRLLAAGYRQLGQGQTGTVFKNPESPHVLKLFDSTDTAYRTFVELARKHENQHFPKFFGKLIAVTPRYYAIRTELLLPSSYRRDNEIEMIDKYIRQMRDYGNSPDTYLYMEANPELKRAADLIVDVLKPGKFFCDIHQPNVMLRGDVLVLTDPIAN